MNFLNLQQYVRDLIAANATFVPVAAASVLVDLGFSKSALEASISSDTGYSIAVWPPSKGNAHDENSGQVGIESTIIVRLEISPVKLKAVNDAYLLDNTKPTAYTFFSTLISSIISAVLSDPPEAGGVKFSVSQEPFELVNFDEGLIAYHLRFNRFTVFGT